MKPIFISLVIAALAVGLTTIPQNSKADQTLPEKPGVLVRMTGPVKAIEMDTCMDGATCILTQTLAGQETKTRLKPANDDVKKILAEAAISGAQVTAVGHMGSTIPQCSYLEVVSAEIAKVVAKAAN